MPRWQIIEENPTSLFSKPHGGENINVVSGSKTIVEVNKDRRIWPILLYFLIKVGKEEKSMHEFEGK